jgi:outer membrane protein OmpA-like peptidoglycan-associated protein
MSRAINPTSGASLLDRSKATPGSVNMAIFEKKTAAGQGTVNSNYLQQTREDNPEPVADQAATTVTLSNCKITTDPEKLAAEQPFEMSVDIKGPDGSTSGTVTFNLFCCIPKADGTETVEDESSPATGTVKDGSAVARGTLVSPKDPVAAGTKLKYYVVAQHASANETAESPKIEVEAGKTPDPLAVWCLGSVHFGFGSSFIMPSVATELESLKKLKDQNADAGYAVFGHADPVGEDDFNKTLSGRRANALYCLLTQNADGWVQLSKGMEGDKWSTKAHQTILSFLKNDTGAPFYSGSINGSDDAATKSAIESFQKFTKLKPDGIIGPQTKAKLYAVYMEKLSNVVLKPEDFVGDPKDPKVQWACSGCSEFNPLLVFSKADDSSFKSSEKKSERDAKNAPNRRATVFLFPPGTKGPGNVTFPCPTWTDNSSKCKAQWFSDADTRRNPAEAERTWEASKDTFACQFYAKIGKSESLSGSSVETGFNLRLWYSHSSAMKVGSVKLISSDGVEKQYKENSDGIIEIKDPYTGVAQLEFSINGEIVKKYIAPNPSEIGTDEGVWHRLLNLGYFNSDCKVQPKEMELASGVQSFQLEHSLDPNAEIDDATRQKIDEVYTSTFAGHTPSVKDYNLNSDQLSVTKVI